MMQIQIIIMIKIMKVMKNKILIVGLLLFSITGISQNITEPTLIKKCGTKDLDISYQKWKLPNGLTVLIHEDHSDQIEKVLVNLDLLISLNT
jgi:zinc protease